MYGATTLEKRKAVSVIVNGSTLALLKRKGKQCTNFEEILPSLENWLHSPENQSFLLEK